MKKDLDMTDFMAGMKKVANEDQAVNEIKMISVYDMMPNEKNHYSMNEKEIEKLAALIELQGGVKSALKLKPFENKYKIISGHRRQKAVIMLLAASSDIITEPEVPCYVDDYTEEEEILELIASNAQRKKTLEDEEAEIEMLEPVARKAYEAAKNAGEKGKFRKFFAENILGISESKLQRTQSLKKLDPEVRKKLDEGKISRNSAEKLTTLPPKKQKKVLSETEQKLDITAVTAKDIEVEKAKLQDSDKGVQIEHHKNKANVIENINEIPKNEMVNGDKSVQIDHLENKKKSDMLVKLIKDFKAQKFSAEENYKLSPSPEGKFLITYLDKLIKMVENDIKEGV